ncbi:MAG: cell envelope biogenesis protein LolA [Rhodobacterales bacterium]|nr:MAG: cell envelope biogenesis protein LolA [Rhodobacterales bacterium]
MKKLFLIPLVWAMLCLPASAQKLALNQISSYLNKFTTAHGGFTQINADGTISTGKIYIHRPGRVRFEYAPPSKDLVMAGGGQVAIFDGKSNTGPEQYPLKRTPLNLILRKNVNLAADRMVIAHKYDGKTTTVVAQDPKHPDYGHIKLLFTANPVELRQWVIVDGSGSKTTLILNKLQRGSKLSNNLFSIAIEADRRSR